MHIAICNSLTCRSPVSLGSHLVSANATSFQFVVDSHCYMPYVSTPQSLGLRVRRTLKYAVVHSFLGYLRPQQLTYANLTSR